MSSETLLASAAFSLVGTTVYAYVGWTLAQRKVSEDAALASKAFAVWWLSLAGLTFVGGAQTLAAAFGFVSFDFYLVFIYISLLVLCIALWGMLYYLVYLFTGRHGAWLPLAAFYAVTFVILTYYIVARGPTGVEVGRWSVTLQYAHQVTGILGAVLVPLIILPQFLSAAAYGTVYFRVQDRTLRYRIALVSVSIMVWFGSSLLANATGLSTNDTWQIVSRFIGLAAALTILVAYQPPPFLRKRLGVRSVKDEAGPGEVAFATQQAPRSAPVAGRAWARRSAPGA